MQNQAELKVNIDIAQSRQQALAAAREVVILMVLESCLPDSEIEPLFAMRREELEQQWRVEDAPVRLRADNGYAKNGKESTMDAANESKRITLANLRTRYALQLGNHNALLNEILGFLNNPRNHEESPEMQAITRSHRYTQTAAARAITFYRQMPVADQGNIIEEMCLFWCAARDIKITTSTVPNRTAAFIMALENAARGENRTSGVKDRDDLAPDGRVCAVGAGNLLCLSMSSINNGYDAVHPDDVFVPVLRGATPEQIAECIYSTFKAIFELRSSSEKTMLGAQSNCEKESELTTAQLSCWIKFRDHIVKAAMATLFSAYGEPVTADQKPDTDNIKRMSETCMKNCMVLRTDGPYGQYGDPVVPVVVPVPLPVEKKEDKESRKINEAPAIMHIHANEAEKLYTQIFTHSQALLEAMEDNNPMAEALRARLEELDYDVLANELAIYTSGYILEQFFIGLGNTARPTPSAVLVEPILPVVSPRPAVTPMTNVVPVVSPVVPVARSVVPPPPSVVARPAIVPQAEMEAARQQRIRERLQKEQDEREVIAREQEAARKAAQKRANLESARILAKRF